MATTAKKKPAAKKAVAKKPVAKKAAAAKKPVAKKAVAAKKPVAKKAAAAKKPITDDAAAVELLELEGDSLLSDEPPLLLQPASTRADAARTALTTRTLLNRISVPSCRSTVSDQTLAWY